MSGEATLAGVERNYSAAMRWMHWSTVSLLIGSYSTAWAIESASSSAEKAGFVLLHQLVARIDRFAGWRELGRVGERPLS